MDTVDFAEALRWIAELAGRDVEILVGANGSGTQAVLDGRLKDWDPEANGIESPVVLRVRDRARVLLAADDFDRASRDTDGGVRLHMGDLEVSVTKDLPLERTPIL